MPIILIIAIILGGSGLAAEASVPGNPFYAVKVGVNENVRGLFAFSDKAKAEWDARRAERRLEEVEKLSSRNNLDADVRARLEANFQEFADRAEVRIGELFPDDPEKAFEVAAHFQTSLDTHARILRAIIQLAHPSIRSEAGKLIARVDREEQEVAGQKADAERELRTEQGPDVRSAAEGKRGAVVNKMREVMRQIERIKAEFGVNAAAQADARLKIAQDTLALGDARFQAGAYGEAFILFQKAHSIAQETQLLIEAKSDFEEPEDKPERTPSRTTTPTRMPRESENESDSERRPSTPSIESETQVRVKIELGL